MIWSLFKILEKFEILSICYFVLYNDSTSKFRNNMNVKTKKFLKILSANNKQTRLFHVRDKRIDSKWFLMPPMYLIYFVLWLLENNVLSQCFYNFNKDNFEMSMTLSKIFLKVQTYFIIINYIFPLWKLPLPLTWHILIVSFSLREVLLSFSLIRLVKCLISSYDQCSFE